MSEICERCGRDLDTLGPWKDFVHYRKDRPGENEPCFDINDEDLDPVVVEILNNIADRIYGNMVETMKFIDVYNSYSSMLGE